MYFIVALQVLVCCCIAYLVQFLKELRQDSTQFKRTTDTNRIDLEEKIASIAYHNEIIKNELIRIDNALNYHFIKLRAKVETQSQRLCNHCLSRVEESLLDKSLCHAHPICFQCSTNHVRYGLESDNVLYKIYHCEQCLQVKRLALNVHVNVPLNFENE